MKHKWIIAVIIATVAVALLFGNTYFVQAKIFFRDTFI